MLDAVMHDLREVFSKVEIKISEPFTSFAETVSDTSSVCCFTQTPNKKNKIQMVADPLERGLASELPFLSQQDSQNLSQKLV